MRRLIKIIFTAACAATFGAWAQAAGPMFDDKQVLRDGCAPEPVMLRALRREFQEREVARGFLDAPVPIPVRLTVSSNGSWTMLAPRADGLLCIQWSGRGFRMVGAPPLPGINT